MTCTHFAKGQVLFREGDPADSVFLLLRAAAHEQPARNMIVIVARPNLSAA
jgi:hypothetical protein